MATSAVLLDNATIGRAFQVLDGSAFGTADEALYVTSLSNLLNAVVLCKEIYVLRGGSKRPHRWERSPHAERLSALLRSVAVEARHERDLTETAFAKSGHILGSETGSRLVSRLLRTSVGQLRRKGIEFPLDPPEGWHAHPAFDGSAVALDPYLQQRLEELLAILMAAPSAAESGQDAREGFSERFEAPVALGVSLLYWLVYRTQFYHVASSALPRPARSRICTYLPSPARADLYALEPRRVQVDLLELFLEAIRHFDERAAKKLAEQSGVHLRIVPVPPVFQLIADRSRSLDDMLEEAIVLRNARPVRIVRDYLIRIEEKISAGSGPAGFARELTSLREVVAGEWGTDLPADSSSRLGLLLSGELGLGKVTGALQGLSVRSISNVRRRMRLRKVVKSIRSMHVASRDAHRASDFWQLPISRPRTRSPLGLTRIPEAALTSPEVRHLRKLLGVHPEFRARDVDAVVAFWRLFGRSYRQVPDILEDLGDPGIRSAVEEEVRRLTHEHLAAEARERLREKSRRAQPAYHPGVNTSTFYALNLS